MMEMLPEARSTFHTSRPAADVERAEVVHREVSATAMKLLVLMSRLALVAEPEVPSPVAAAGDGGDDAVSPSMRRT